MPIITVMGVPDGVQGLELLMEKIRIETAKIKKLDLSANDVTVFFPSDLAKEARGEEIIVFVEGLFKRPNRTLKVRQELAKTLARAIKPFFKKTLSQCKMVEVFVREFDPEKDGFTALRL
ncbi:hypothetical protein KJ969_02035 [Patescibacteria group bacterium]|nr:hypothetical protein [Patescibacteria group bacterium]MBU1921667.1 hypothetical protein [Patescibacteria group bacterium]